MFLLSKPHTWWRSGVCVAACTALFISTGASFGSHPSASESARDPGEKHRGFTLSAGTCEQGPGFCAIATPRPWTADERALVGDSLDEIWRSEYGRRVAQLAARNGFQVIRRFTAAAQGDSEGHFEVEPQTVASVHRDDRHAIRSVDVTDQFFLRRTARTAWSSAEKLKQISASYKPAILDNGVRVMVPPHIVTGTRIVVDVYEREYVKRAD